MNFKTINGKEYKNVTVNQIEADGIVIKTKTGISSTVKVLPIGLRALSKKSSTSGNRSYKGNTPPGSAELMVRREFNFHWAFLAGTAIIASVLFAIVWRRFK
jgi:hypothetical protein